MLMAPTDRWYALLAGSVSVWVDSKWNCGVDQVSSEDQQDSYCQTVVGAIQRSYRTTSLTVQLSSATSSSIRSGFGCYLASESVPLPA